MLTNMLPIKFTREQTLIEEENIGFSEWEQKTHQKMLFSCFLQNRLWGFLSIFFFFYHKTLVWACLSVMQVFVCFKQSPGALKVFRPQGERSPDVRRTASLAPKGPGTETDTAGNMGHKYTSAHALSLTRSLSCTHRHCNSKVLNSKTNILSRH